LTQFDPKEINTFLNQSFNNLFGYVQKHHYAGYDPHDALNSPVLSRVFGHNRYTAIFVLQFFRKSFINFRPLFGVKQGVNPKAFALFLSAIVKLANTPNFEENIARYFAEWLDKNRSHAYAHACWGYNFDWPNRAFYAKAGTPTVVNTVFVAHSILDYYDLTREEKWLELALSAADFILNDLHQIKMAQGICFSYTPFDHRCVHNANLLAAGLLARSFKYSKKERYLDMAGQAAGYSISQQRQDGSWPYGASHRDKWVDHFHTAFNLLALWEYSKIVPTGDVKYALQLGYNYYKNHLFDGFLPKYFPTRLFPVDVHSIATAVIALLTLPFEQDENKKCVIELLKWAIPNMQSKNGAFYYQKNKYSTNKNIYMRWGQAWMYLALATCLEQFYERN